MSKWKRVWLAAALCLVAAGLTVAGVNSLVLRSSREHIYMPDEVPPAQVAIVLGAYVYPDGTPSPMVADRLETAYSLYQAGKVEKLLISGDHGQIEYDEVNAMRRYLEAKGVPPEDIFMDHAGFDTYDSMYRARDVFLVEDAIIVTQAFHLPRAVYLARALGLNAVGAVADRFSYAGAEYYDLREVAARVKAFGEVVTRQKPVFLGPQIPITGDGRATHDQ